MGTFEELAREGPEPMQIRGQDGDPHTAPPNGGSPGLRHWGGDLTTPVTKVTAPHLAGRNLRRDHLLTALDQLVFESPVTLVAAPAGFGKTSLLAQWSGHTGHTVGWLTVDEFDSDPSRLFRNIVAALQVAAVTAGRTDADFLLDLAPGTRGPGSANWPEQYDGLLRSLEALQQPVVLVLDDLHELSGTPARDMLARLVRLSPPGFHLVFSSRSDPDLPLHRLRLAGELGEVREHHLAFSDAEVQALAALSGHSLPAEDVEALTAFTKGWPAAVRMALLTVDHETAAGHFAGMQGGDLPLTEYLTEEVLAAMRPDLARFVLQATTGDLIDAELADTLHGGVGGAELLAEAVHAGVFLTPRPGEDGELSYRWHAVFASQCRAILRRTSPGTVHQLHLTVANYWRTRDAFESIAAALAGGDPALAADVLRERWPEILLRSDPGTIGQLCERIPAPISDDPELLQLRALGEILDGGSGAATMLSARAGAGTLPRGRRKRFDLVDTLAATFLTSVPRDPEIAVRNAVEALDQATDVPVIRALGHLLVGETAALLQGGLPTAFNHLRAGAALAVENHLSAVSFACRATLSVPLFREGHFDEADSLARDAIARARRSGQHLTSVVVPAYLTCGLAEFWRDDLRDARRTLLQVVRLATARQAGYRLHAALVLLLVALAEDDVAAADQARAVVTEQAARLPPTYTAGFAEMVEAAAADARGDPGEALARVPVPAPGKRDPIAALWEAEARRRAGDATGARAVLAQIPEGQRVAQIDVGATLTEALLEVDGGNAAAAHRDLERALEVASVSGIRRPFRERALDVRVRGLLHAHQDRGTRFVEFLADVLARLPEHGDGHRRRSYWELTDRELTVLTYLSSPLTTAEIAEALFVSTNTIKTHMRAIYRKLGASGRRDAVRIAAERLPGRVEPGSGEGTAGAPTS
jgi:LuxR family transcriptional regulator, maltose regulon positive regulatory protein